MLKILIKLGSLVGVLSVASLAYAQAKPTAVTLGNLQVGAGYTLGKPDYGYDWIGGISAFGNWDFTQHLGIEADAHIVNLHTPLDLAEESYVAGPRYTYRKGRFAPYGKFVAGVGKLVIQETEDNPGRYNGSYFMYAFGGGIEIKATRHIVVRAFDLEYQIWPGLGPHGLTPSIGTSGVAYRF